MGDFAANLAISYEVRAARGDYSTLSAMDVNREEFFASFGQTINDLIINHRENLERRRQEKPSMSAFSESLSPSPLHPPHLKGAGQMERQSIFAHLRAA